MNKRNLCFGFLASALLLSGPLPLSAQTTTVESVVGADGRTVPSASGILNPQITQGRFGTSIQGGYLGPNPYRPENRFSSGALYNYSGEFIGMMGDADSARSEAIRRGGEPEEGDSFSDIDRLLILRHMRSQALAQEEPSETPVQRSAVPYPEQPSPPAPAPSAPSEQVAAAPQPPEPVTPVPSEEEPLPQPPSEQIWMRGSARYTEQAARRRADQRDAASSEELMIDPRWFEFGAESLPPEASPAPSADQAPPPPADPFAPIQEGTVIGGRLPEPAAVPAPAENPSEQLARNGRQELRQSAAAAQQLETRLLQSPLVSPLAPMRVTLNGSTAVVTGIVGSQEARVEAGKILLRDSRVETVDNRIVVYDDSSLDTEASASGESSPENTASSGDAP